MKIRPLGASCCMRTEGRTDRRRETHDEANSHFSQCCERT